MKAVTNFLDYVLICIYLQMIPTFLVDLSLKLHVKNVVKVTSDSEKVQPFDSESSMEEWKTRFEIFYLFILYFILDTLHFVHWSLWISRFCIGLLQFYGRYIVYQY